MICFTVTVFSLMLTNALASKNKFPTAVHLVTPNLYKYVSLDELGVEIGPRQSSFRFQVRANNDAHIALLQSAGDTTKNIYEIVIGGWKNSKSVIRTTKLAKEHVSKSHVPLDGSKFLDFWISWTRNVISVGSGTKVGQGTFMSWTDPEPHDVNFLAVSSWTTATCSWKFVDGVRRGTFGLSTGVDFKYQSVPIAFKRSITFSVMANNDAHIGLLSHEGDSTNNMYEIVIGGWGNTQSVIRDKNGGPILAYAKHSPNCAKQHVPFWISFIDGTISVGYGNVVGRRRFMFWKDESPNKIKFISVSTGWKSTGHWLFSKRGGRKMKKEE